MTGQTTRLPAGLSVRPEQYYAAVFVNWILQKARDALIESHQNPTRCPSRLHDCCVIRPDQSFAMNGISVVPQTHEIVRKFVRKILI